MAYPAALQTIEQAKAEQWEELNLSRMELTEVPPEIAQLTNLQSLDLRSFKCDSNASIAPSQESATTRQSGNVNA